MIPTKIPVPISTPNNLSQRGSFIENIDKRLSPVSIIKTDSIVSSIDLRRTTLVIYNTHHAPSTSTTYQTNSSLYSFGVRTVTVPSSLICFSVVSSNSLIKYSFSLNSKLALPLCTFSKVPPTVPLELPYSYPFLMGSTLYDFWGSNPLKSTSPSSFVRL